MQELSRAGGKVSHPFRLGGVLLALLVSWSCETAPLRESQSIPAASPASATETQQERKSPVAQSQLTKGQEHFVLKELWAGTILEQRGDHEGARLHYRRILYITPKSPHVLTQLAKSYLETNEIDRALEAAQKAVEADPSKAAASEVLGQAYARKQNWAKAAEQYQRVLEYNPYSVSALLRLAEMQASAGEIDKAIETYKRLIKVDPGRSGIYYYYIASLLTNTQRYAEAVDAYLQLLEEYPDRFETYRQVGLLYQQLNRFDEAIAVYLRALRQGPSPDAEMLIRSDLAQLYLRRGSRAEAYAQYARIHELSPKNSTALYFMSLLLLESKDYDRALVTTDELLALRPNDPQAVLLKCEIYSEKEQWDKGADLFLEAFLGVMRGRDLSPSERAQGDQFAAAILKPATRNLFVQGHRVKELVAALRRGLEKLPDSHYLPLALLVFEVQVKEEKADLSGDIELVLERWDAALAQNDRDTYDLYLASLYDNGALRYVAEGTFSPIVLDILWRASERFEDDAVSPLVLSNLRFSENDWESAEKALQLVRKRTEPNDPRHHAALELLGLTYEKMKRLDDAVEVIKKMIEVSPESANGYNMLGYLYADNNRNLSEAETLVKKALELAPNDGNYIDSLGWVYYRQGRHREALETLIQAKEKSQEEHPIIYDHLGDAYQATGQVREAVEMWRKALEVGPRFRFDFTPELKRTIEEKVRAAEQNVKP